jgi:hypothetical protein
LRAEESKERNNAANDRNSQIIRLSQAKTLSAQLRSYFNLVYPIRKYRPAEMVRESQHKPTELELRVVAEMQPALWFTHPDALQATSQFGASSHGTS